MLLTALGEARGLFALHWGLMCCAISLNQVFSNPTHNQVGPQLAAEVRTRCLVVVPRPQHSGEAMWSPIPAAQKILGLPSSPDTQKNRSPLVISPHPRGKNVISSKQRLLLKEEMDRNGREGRAKISCSLAGTITEVPVIKINY